MQRYAFFFKQLHVAKMLYVLYLPLLPDRYLLRFCLKGDGTCPPSNFPSGAAGTENHPPHLYINDRNTAGCTPLELAVSQGHLDVVKYVWCMETMITIISGLCTVYSTGLFRKLTCHAIMMLNTWPVIGSIARALAAGTRLIEAYM